MSPEYATDGTFSVKSDIFSLGVLMLEIVSGIKNRGFSHPNHHHNLLGHVSVKYSLSHSLSLSSLGEFGNVNYNCSRHGCCGRRTGPWNYWIHVWRIHAQDLKY